MVSRSKWESCETPAFESRGAAWVAAVILLRQETWKRQHPDQVLELERQSISFDWKRIESGNYISRSQPYRAFRSGNKWRLEVNGNIVESVFETRGEAWMGANVLFRKFELPKQYA